MGISNALIDKNVPLTLSEVWLFSLLNNYVVFGTQYKFKNGLWEACKCFRNEHLYIAAATM